MPLQSELTSMTAQEIAKVLGTDHQQVLRDERMAMRKFAIAYRIIDLLGERESERVFAVLRGQKLSVFERALAEIERKVAQSEGGDL